VSTLADNLATGLAAGVDGPVVDCDVHASVASLEVLEPYIEPKWRKLIGEWAWSGPPGVATVHPPGAPSTVRPEWRSEAGPPPATDVEMLARQALDPWNVGYAIVNCYYALDSFRHPDLAVVLARAVNDWLIAEWLERDSRLRASLVVPAFITTDTVAEIERVGDHPGFVQVLMPVRAQAPYGNRNWHPVLEAITRHDLVFGMQWGGTSGGPPSPSGWPSWFVEEYAAEQQVYMSQLVSLVGEGVFKKFPALRMAVLDIGFGWLPSLLWRLDKEWKGLRRMVPWIDRPASALVREHMRFSTTPLDAGPLDETIRLLEWAGEDVVMFGSDYPHQHDDDLGGFLAALPHQTRSKVVSGNARAFYGL
jgi:predicted TIM-barrel fold metal-dependent hydrolase